MKPEQIATRPAAPKRPRLVDPHRRRAVASFDAVLGRKSAADRGKALENRDKATLDSRSPEAQIAKEQPRFRRPGDDEDREPFGIAEARPAELAVRSDMTVAQKAPVATPELDPAFDRIIREAVLMQDSHRRKRLALRLEVPGRGALQVRIRRGSHGTEVDFHADHSDLADTVRRHRGELIARARANGIGISRVGVSSL